MEQPAAPSRSGLQGLRLSSGLHRHLDFHTMNFTLIGASLLLALPVTFTRGCSAGDKAKEIVTAAAYPPHDTLQKPLPDF